MGSKQWGICIGVLLLLCIATSVSIFVPREPAAEAEIWLHGELLRVVKLQEDQTFTVETEDGRNVITVKDGKIAVTDADCPDGYCMRRGFCHSGTDIVCLPNRLVIKFIGTSDVDAVVG